MTETGTPTVSEAQAVLEQDRKERLEDCQHRLDALLKTYRCTLGAQIIVSNDGRLVANVVLVDAS